MDVLTYLTKLIKIRKEVGILGLGTLYKKKSPGRYDVATHSFLPPTYILSFTSDLKEQVLLIDFVSKEKNVSLETASYYVDQFSEGIKEQLATTEKADLGELGTLFYENGAIVLRSDQATNVGFEFYGLPSLKDRSIAEENTNLENVINDNTSFERVDDLTEDAAEPSLTVLNDIPEEIIDGEVIDVEDVFVENATEEPVPPEKKGLPGYLIAFIIAGIVLVAVIAGYFINPKLFKNSSQANTQGAEPDTTAKVNTATADSMAKDSTDSVALITTTPVDSTKASLANKSLNEPVDVDSATTWEVIGASVINHKEANWFIVQMKKIGIDAKIIPAVPGKRRLKISIATFPDEVSARAGRKQLVVKLKNPELYIFQNKHTNKSK